jgi:hypothetical protein
VDIPEPLLRNAKLRAAAEGVTLSVWVEDALRAKLAVRPKRTETPFQLHTVRGRLVRPDQDLDRTSELIASEDEAQFRYGRN